MKLTCFINLYEPWTKRKKERKYVMAIDHAYTLGQQELLGLAFTAHFDSVDPKKIGEVDQIINNHEGSSSELVEKIDGILEK